MSVELPFAPVDDIIRDAAGSLRVSAEATEELADCIQDRGAALTVTAAEEAALDGRKTVMASDFDVQEIPEAEDLSLPIAPIDRIARLDIDDRYRVGEDARIALAKLLETYATDAAEGAYTLARHADRRTIQAEDFRTYFELVE